MQEGGIGWLGSGNRRVSFYIEPDFDLLFDDDEIDSPTSDVESLFPDAQGRYDFMTLSKQTGLTARALSDRLWQGVWASSVVNDSYGSVRKGLETQFEVPAVATQPSGSARRSRRSSYGSWRGALPLPGNWFSISRPEPITDFVEREEKNKDRVRVLLDRYGILFRELILRESPAFRWPSVFRTLRLMELSGEVIAGYFFEGIMGPQFASPKAFRMFRQDSDADAVYWMNATDPGSLAGLQMDAVHGRLPKRLLGNYLTFRGSELVGTIGRSGKDIRMEVAADDDRITSYFGALKHLLYRDVQPQRTVTVETINGQDAASSDYLDVLRTMFDVRIDYKSVMLYRKTSS